MPESGKRGKSRRPGPREGQLVLRPHQLMTGLSLLCILVFLYEKECKLPASLPSSAPSSLSLLLVSPSISPSLLPFLLLSLKLRNIGSSNSLQTLEKSWKGFE